MCKQGRCVRKMDGMDGWDGMGWGFDADYIHTVQRWYLTSTENGGLRVDRWRDRLRDRGMGCAWSPPFILFSVSVIVLLSLFFCDGSAFVWWTFGWRRMWIWRRRWD